MPDNPTPIIAGTRIGHVHLKVADLDRALGFYCGVLGFELMQRLSSGAAFISAGGYHHHIGLNTWESKGGHPPPPGTTGLFHTAILYPPRPALAAAAQRCIGAPPSRTASSSIGIGPKSNGRASRTDRWRCSRSGWISRICYGSQGRDPHGEEGRHRRLPPETKPSRRR